MAFLIPDNLKSRKDVPNSIRSVARAFDLGLDEDVQVWYEPLYDANDEKPHFVVFIPAAGIVLLEVLEIKAQKVLGVLRGRLRIERDGREIELENPLDRAKRLASALEERIAAEARLNAVSIPVAYGAVLASLSVEDIDKTGIDKILPEGSFITKHDIEVAIAGQSGGRLELVFAQMLKNPTVLDLTEKQITILRGLIQPETVISGTKQDTGNKVIQKQLTIFRPPDEGEDVIRVMDRNQEAIAKSLGEGHRVIRGVAGSGKTLILVYRAKLLSPLFPREKFLMTCYTRSLAGQLRSLMEDYQNVEVINLDKLMFELIRMGHLKHPGYKGDDSGEQVAQVALQAIERGVGPRYRAVFLDEAQDFGTKALTLVTRLLKDGSEDLVVVADAAQNIFRRKFSWRQAGIQAQGRTKILKVNYRNTKEILEFASKFLLSSPNLTADDVPDPDDEMAVIPPESAARSGEKPELSVVSDVMTEIEKTIEKVCAWISNVSAPKSIAVLYPSSMDGDTYRAGKLYDKLRRSGISTFWLNDPSDKTARDRIATSEDTVILCTIHNSKGLEFPKVVMCGVWNERSEAEENRKLAYVGMTRAMESLSVITKSGHPLVTDLEHAIAAV